LDGIDEASDLRDEIIFFITSVLVVGGHHCLCTSRPEGAPTQQFDAFLVLKLMPLTQEDRYAVIKQQFQGVGTAFDKLFELINMREANDKLYSEELRGQQIERLPEVRRSTLQYDLDGRVVTTAQALFETAGLAQPVFESALQNIVTALRLSANQLELVELEGRQWEEEDLDEELEEELEEEGIDRASHIPVHVQRKVKALGASHVKDVLSATLLGKNAEEMLRISTSIMNEPSLTVVGLQNLIQADKVDIVHYRRLVLHVRVKGFKGSSHVAQIVVSHLSNAGHPTAIPSHFTQLFVPAGEVLKSVELERKVRLVERIVSVPVLLSLLVVAMRTTHYVDHDDSNTDPYAESVFPSSLHQLYSKAVRQLAEINAYENNTSDKDTLAMVQQVATFAHASGARVFGTDQAALALEERNLFDTCRNHEGRRRAGAAQVYHRLWNKLTKELRVPSVPCIKVLESSHQNCAYQAEHLSLQEFLCGESFRDILRRAHAHKTARVMSTHDGVRNGHASSGSVCQDSGGMSTQNVHIGER
jgi:hypothetical protein